MSQQRRTNVSLKGEVAVVRFNDKKIVDGASIEQMGDELLSLVKDQRIHHILLNFEGVDLLSSSALNKFIALYKALDDVGGTLRLCNLHPDMRRVFSLTGLDTRLDIRNTEAEALKAFGIS
ncbi:MAG: hypothetical protein KatS3mg111_4143 [Pirellulaceae bacterium]|nr:MAG: hypothetical protein KatS3mg111_4143 [Pirellulaceae bacterium]